MARRTDQARGFDLLHCKTRARARAAAAWLSDCRLSRAAAARLLACSPRNRGTAGRRLLSKPSESAGDAVRARARAHGMPRAASSSGVGHCYFRVCLRSSQAIEQTLQQEDRVARPAKPRGACYVPVGGWRRRLMCRHNRAAAAGRRGGPVRIVPAGQPPSLPGNRPDQRPAVVARNRATLAGGCCESRS